VGAILLLWVSFPQAATFTDGLGRIITLKTPPRRIVTLAPSLTEILYYLGLGDRVVGVTQFSNYPPEVAEKPRVGSYVHLNVEKILSLKPDLAVGTMDGNEAGAVGMLEQAGIPVYVVNPRNVADAIRTVATLGEICGVATRGREMSGSLHARVRRVSEKIRPLRRPLVFLQINVKPIMTVNSHTIHHDVIRLAGGENMTASEPITYPRVSLEEVVRREPEVLIISSMERGGRFERARRAWMAWTHIPAVRSGRVHLVESDLLDRPSPRIVQGLETLARLIHPEVEWKREDPRGIETPWKREKP
jgi:iron complex transport system substrate-binding protein